MSDQTAHELFREIHAMAVALSESGVFDEDDPLLTQSFIEGQTMVPEIIAGVLKSIDEDQVLLSGLKAMIEEFQSRKARIEDRVENKRGLIELVLLRAEIKTLETPSATVSLRAVPAKLANVDEALVPSEYFTVPAPTLDRRKLLADLKEGKQVEGASLSNGGQTVSIRRN